MSFSGGFLSGGLHSLSGLDHLAAILPLSLGRTWWHGLTIGCLWGFGHGIAVCFLGSIGCILKTFLIDPEFFRNLYFLIDYTVGLTLTIIGLFGIYEARSQQIMKTETGETDHDDCNNISHSILSYAGLWAIFVNGHMMGLSLDSLPSLAPVVTTSAYIESTMCLFGYLLSTVFSMALVAAMISFSSMWLGSFFHLTSLYTLQSTSSNLALLIGIFLMLKVKILSYLYCITLTFIIYRVLNQLLKRLIPNHQRQFDMQEKKGSSEKLISLQCV